MTSGKTDQLGAKRLVVCCDGTWQNSNKGVQKSGVLIEVSKLEVPTNVTRLSRSLRHACQDGRVQVVYYQSGVGSEGSYVDLVTGGAFGLGIAQNMREAYSFICANYHDGDEIVLVGFSRGAFTARAVAGMVSDLGLLTRSGMAYFYPIFKDMQNWRTENYKDGFPGVPFDDKPMGEGAEDKYRQMLIDNGKGDLIKVRAVAVWDTVGSLGIPEISWLAWMGIKPSNKQVRFYDTKLSDRIEYAFQALALDEDRPPFSPTVWERKSADEHKTKLRQCWFPGNHGNVGGGWQDAGIANMSLAWMMDQLASIGVEFDEATVERVFTHLERYYRGEAAKLRDPDAPPDPLQDAMVDDPQPSAHGGRLPAWLPFKRVPPPRWAVDPIFTRNTPVRPWGLGAILKPSEFVYRLTGRRLRTPGMYRRPDPATGRATRAFLEDTNERMHSSVRVRLAARGLGANDGHVWTAPALRGRWRVRRTDDKFEDPVPVWLATWEPEKLVAEEKRRTQEGEAEVEAEGEGHGGRRLGVVAEAVEQQRPLSGLLEDERKGRWVWEYCGPEAHAPPTRIMVEDRLGPYERQLLRLAGGEPNVYEYAEGMEPVA